MLYLKLMLVVLLVILGYLLSSRLAIRYKNYAEILMYISNMLNFFRDDIEMQNKSILEMLDRTSAENCPVSDFCSLAAQSIRNRPEKPLGEVFEQSAMVLELPKQLKRSLINEFKYIASALEKPLEQISSQQIVSSCRRIDHMYSEAMDKYKRDNLVYKRIGILSGVALSILMI